MRSAHGVKCRLAMDKSPCRLTFVDFLYDSGPQAVLRVVIATERTLVLTQHIFIIMYFKVMILKHTDLLKLAQELVVPQRYVYNMVFERIGQVLSLLKDTLFKCCLSKWQVASVVKCGTVTHRRVAQ